MNETNKVDTAEIRGRHADVADNYQDFFEISEIRALCDAFDEARADALMFAESNHDLIARKGNLLERLNEEIARVTRAEAKLARVEALIDPSAGMAYLLPGGSRLFSEADIRNALSDSQ